MILLFWIIVIAQIAIVAFIFLFPNKAILKSGKLNKQQENENQDPELQGTIDSLKSELEKKNADYNALEYELEAARKKEQKLEDELARQEQLRIKAEEELRGMKMKVDDLEEKIAHKDEELKETPPVSGGDVPLSTEKEESLDKPKTEDNASTFSTGEEKPSTDISQEEDAQ